MANSKDRPEAGKQRSIWNNKQGNLLIEQNYPLILLILVTISILLIEIIAFFLVNFRQNPSIIAAALLDALTTTD